MSANTGIISPFQKRLTGLYPLRYAARAVLERFLPLTDGTMTSKERVTRAIELTGPDRVPHRHFDVYFLGSTPPVAWQPPEPYYPYVHPIQVKMGSWKWKKRKNNSWLREDRTAIDEFGVVWRVNEMASQGEFMKSPLGDGWHGLKDYVLPDYTDPARLKDSLAGIKLLNPDRYFVFVDMNAEGPGELVRHLRGFENSMIDYYENPEELRELIGMIKKMFLDLVDNIHKSGLAIDAFEFVDDWGTQLNSLISPRHFDEFYVPLYREVIDRCHQYGFHCGIHSCGAINFLIPSMIDAGFDYLQLDSPDMVGIDWLAENIRGKIALFCAVDIQHVYNSNDLEKVEAYVKELISKLACPDGGFVAWPYTEPYDIGVAMKTVRAEQRFVKKYGRYPIG